MGKTYKDKAKWERKKRSREVEQDVLVGDKKLNKRPKFHEAPPAAGEVDPYEIYEDLVRN